jgi:hypothetical protein
MQFFHGPKEKQIFQQKPAQNLPGNGLETKVIQSYKTGSTD